MLNEGREAYLKITIMDMFAKDELRAIISRRFQVGAKKPVDFSLVGLVNKRLIPVLLLTAGISDFNQRRVADLIAEEVARIVDVLTDWRFRIRGRRVGPTRR